MVLVAVVAVYIFVTGGEFSPEKAFVSILIFNILDFPVEVRSRSFRGFCEKHFQTLPNNIMRE